MAAKILTRFTVQNTQEFRMSSLVGSLWRTSQLTVFFLGLLTFANGYRQFEDGHDPSNPDIILQNMVVDRTNGNIFVGSVNQLYKLESDLTEIVALNTGPLPDHPECRPPPRECVDDEGMELRTDTNTINKLLLVHDNELLTCFNIYQGACQKRDLDTLEETASYTREVVSNYKHGRAVGFIAPGPSGDALYTSTPSGDWLRSGIPTLSRRLLQPDVFDDPFDPTSEIVVPQNTLDEAIISAQYAFNISYVYGFSSGTHSYFVALQVEEYKIKESPQRTKIARVCQQDANPLFHSYVELPIKCTSPDGSIDYNLAQSAFIASTGSDLADVKAGEDVLFVTFSESIGGSSLEPTDMSAVCMYSVRQIDAMIAERRIECAMDESNTDVTEIEWLGNTPCFADQDVVDSLTADPTGYCHTDNFNQPLGSNDKVIEAMALYTTDNTVLTAIAATPHLEETVLFLGDQQGSLRKLRVTSNTTARLYEEIALDEGSAVAQNGLQFDAAKDYIYVMTERKITKVPVEECGNYENCEDCTQVGDGVGDPYCGWCSLQKNCTRRNESECSGSDDLNSRRWLGPASMCSQVESVVPANTPRDRYTEIELMITNLPRLDDGTAHTYECVFVDVANGEFATTTATVEFMTDRTNITCGTPPANNIPTPTEGSLTVELYIRASETNQKIAMTTFDFYECSAFSGCLQCVDNSYACDWCIYENTCTGNADNCNSDGVIGSRNSTNVERTKKGPEFCPYIKQNGEEILIPVDVYKGIDILAANLPDPKTGGDFECVILLDGEEAKVEATRENDTLVRCSPWNYMYGAEVATVEVALNVQWNGSFILDNPDQLTVTLYKCNVGRSNCGSCLMADSKFKCGWCVERPRCVHETKCRGTDSEFLFGDNVCPNPQITGFEPKAGHIAGGTEVKIYGVNLGQMASDIVNIKVAGQPCEHLNDSYVPSEIVMCRTSPIPMPMRGMVEVSIGTGGDIYAGLSTDFFSYVQPTIGSFSPLIGPASGGTEVVIQGTHLDIGSRLRVEVAQENCTVITELRMADTLTCRTDPGIPEQAGPIRMVFEDDGIEMSRDTFSYKPDPTIDSMDKFRTIIGGGLTVKVKGTNLNVIKSPKMVFHVAQRKFDTECYDIQPTSMTCETPNLQPSNLTTPFEIDKSMIGFTLDGVTAFRTLTNVGNVRDKFEVYQDPIYYKFDTEGMVVEFEYGQRKYLEIRGENLTLASESDDPDVQVFIGEGRCQPQLKSSELTCDLPDKQPNSLQGDSLPRVVVKHGNLEFDIGFVKYLPEGLPLALLIGPAAGGFILILIIILIIAIYRHIGERDRRIKRLEKQRDEMEMRVAQECKDAFTELQISVLTVSGDVEGSGIPLRTYRGYTSMVLFPDNPDHPALKEIPVAKEKISGIKKEVLQNGLMEFGNLIGNKSFLRVFTHTLERQKMLTTKDKTNIASLLMIALHNKMEYLTEVIKCMMQDMIARYVREGCPHVLMRRSDTVVEKLVSHWVAFLLYDFVRETAGQPLFHLYYAIKQQVAKGPVDAITGEARYGLSELKVIRQQTDYKAMMVEAVGLDREAGPVQVKVLDCDTISQVKEKILDAIYKTMPYSQRPQKEELDLEWKDGCMILLDDDGSREMEGEWKRLNTLAHYKVPDGATLVLVRSQGMASTPHGSLQRGSPTKRGNLYTPHSPASSVTPILDMENGIGVMHNWHLVKKQNHDSLRKGDKYHTLMAEIYLPRLLTTKGILQQFVDELFETLFTLESDSSSVPIAIKYLFDFLDEEAARHNLEPDSNITHFWKSNILQLRFWVNMVNNPDMLFDINRSDTVLACMSVIGQTLMDSCSVTQHQLTPDSPSSKLLYAKDIQQYKEMVSSYYRDVRDYPAISDQDMNAALASHSQRHNSESNFQAINALNELYFCYACIYRSQLMEALDENETTKKQGLGDKLDKIFKLMADSV